MNGSNTRRSSGFSQYVLSRLKRFIRCFVATAMEGVPSVPTT